MPVSTPVRPDPRSERERPGPPTKQISKSHFSFYTKLGLLATCTLSIGLALILASLGFLWFLWLANDENKLWRAIVNRNWVTRAIALASLAIRQSVSFHASVATAMIAGLALERMIVLLLNLASVSTTRNANGGPYMLLWWLWKAFHFNPHRWKTVFLPLLITILTSTTILIQLTSFALLSDVDLVTTRASSETRSIQTHFAYDQNGTIPTVTHGSTWSQQLQSYVSFAEYHEQPSGDSIDGVDDTGLTLRAFLPIVDEQTRFMTASWDGLAAVLDARTVCIRPTLLEPRVHYADLALGFETGFTIDLGSHSPTELGLEAISAPVFGCPSGDCPEATACYVPLTAVDSSGDFQLNQTQFSQWRLVVCQPSSDAAQTLWTLQSAFQVPGQGVRRAALVGEPNYSFGNAYVVVNVSSGSEAEWANAIPGEDPNLGIFRGSGTSPVGYSVHGQNNEWYDLIFSEDATLNLSVSVCYTAFDAADLHVQIEASGNHSDITPSWNTTRQAFDYSDIRAQFGQDLGDGSVTYSKDSISRNIMTLEKRASWVPEPDFGDYVVPRKRITETNWIADYANMAGSLQSNAFDYEPGSNWTRFLWQNYQVPNLWNARLSYDYADTSLTGLVQEILQTGGSLAFAMQSVVTVLSELAYYQQLQQLNGISNVTKSPYVQASAPVRKRGLIAVTAVLGVHILIVFCFVLPIFLWQTKISTLGNAWQAVAQLIDPKTKPLLDKAALAIDSQAEEQVKVRTGRKNKLKNHEMVGLFSPDGRSVEIKSAANNAADTEHGTPVPASAKGPSMDTGDENNGEPQEDNRLLQNDEPEARHTTERPPRDTD